VHKHDTEMVTSRMLGCFRDNCVTRQDRMKSRRQCGTL
jgi:hypothetical protein